MRLDLRQKTIILSAIETFGKEHQIGKLFEEIAELEEAIIKNHFGRDNAEHIAEEIADVEIMLDQIKLLFADDELLTKYRAAKLARLRHMITEQWAGRKEAAIAERMGCGPIPQT